MTQIRICVDSLWHEVSQSVRPVDSWMGGPGNWETGVNRADFSQVPPSQRRCECRNFSTLVEAFQVPLHLFFIHSAPVTFSYKKLRKIFSVHLHERHHYQQGVAKQSTQSHCSVCCHKLALSQIQHPQQATLAALSPIPPLYHSSRGKSADFGSHHDHDAIACNT